jgi:hypothetical protein
MECMRILIDNLTISRTIESVAHTPEPVHIKDEQVIVRTSTKSGAEESR